MSEPDATIARADNPCVTVLRPSPNHGARVGRDTPDSIILHYTGMSDGEAAIRWLCDPASGVSCHYVVAEDGTVSQLVAESRRAWHAGRSVWHGETDLNSASVGIEIVNPGHSGGLPPFPAPQIAAVIGLCQEIVTRRAIAPNRVLAHSDIAPGRKEDPGERFPWEQLWRAGVADWVPEHRSTVVPAELTPSGADDDIAALQVALARYGYGVAVSGIEDAATATVVRAFQRRFRPSRIDGRADEGTRLTLDALLNGTGRRLSQT